jgi:hypothetical protein
MTMDIVSGRASVRTRWTPAPLVITDGSVEAIKWLALVLMTFDHIDKYLLHETIPALFDAGRLAMPLFATVFGLNMARPRTANSQHYGKTIIRLLVAWAAATPVCLALGGLAWGWWPLNVMSMFALTASVMWLVDGGGRARFAAAALLFVLGGVIVEYWWPGMVLCLAAWRYAKRPTWSALTMWLCAAAALTIINHNWWALAAVPVLLLAGRTNFGLPRVRLLFYVYYPVHLAIILLAVHFLR